MVAMTTTVVSGPRGKRQFNKPNVEARWEDLVEACWCLLGCRAADGGVAEEGCRLLSHRGRPGDGSTAPVSSEIQGLSSRHHPRPRPCTSASSYDVGEQPTNPDKALKTSVWCQG